MNEIIRRAQLLQEEELTWVSNLYRQRLHYLQETEVLRQEWLKEQGNQIKD